jgi:hypothetical protein
VLDAVRRARAEALLAAGEPDLARAQRLYESCKSLVRRATELEALIAAGQCVPKKDLIVLASLRN